ncbi:MULTISPECIES: NADPH-dependent F420 reductase [unclassified Methylobacterium]|uniref:NADPH-dependent F420 reductase n=1 Tax=unclassified Methylobacterium TaxID=2615210 RepID=UPI0006FE4373|nr:MULTISPECIES: NAD(P)-binding domain-containing protein [unclassified Methylobacterium]KQP07950.1 NADP oxidoreductase [Methylobacterium sp. Leaf99]KQP40353.1 NADP oxidoreductase [Methylobacterium sp. Leaf106]TXN27667.1 NADP oxidoreductase [Methylobacterium sp. WL19]
MSIGIIGSGALGSNAARAFAAKGLDVILSNSRGPESLAGLVQEIGPHAKAGTIAEAAGADIVLVAVPWVHIQAALHGLPAWNGRVVIDGTNAVEFLAPDSPDRNDASNPLAAYGIKAIDLGGQHSSAVFSEFVPGARVVKAFNHLDVNVLPEPETAGGKRVLFYSGDDVAAKGAVRDVIETAGFFPIDLGTLDVGGPLAGLPFGSLATLNLVKI